MTKVFLLIVVFSILQSCLDQKKQAEIIFRHYLDQNTAAIRDYSKECSLASWNATVSGKESDYKKLIDLELNFSKLNNTDYGVFTPDKFSTVTRNVFLKKDDFELLKNLKISGLITDTLLSRQLVYLYYAFLQSQIKTNKYKKLLENGRKLSYLSKSLKFELDGKLLSAKQIDSIKRSAVKSEYLREISTSYQARAQKIAPGIIQLVKDRNDIALSVGFSDYYHMQFESRGESPDKFKMMLDEIEQKTRARFFEAKRVIDKRLAKRYGVKVEELCYWNYNNLGVSYLPQKFIEELDSVLKSIGPVHRTVDFFKGIGIDIQSIIDNSDLKSGPVNTIFNIDFKNDIRLVGRVTDSFDGLAKMMHLGAHAAHYINISENIPYLLQEPNPVIAEGIARYFENMVYDSKWLDEEIESDAKTWAKINIIIQHFREVDKLFSIRGQMAIADFEREIYLNPEQDLDHLWRELNIKYLDIKYPDEKGACFWAENPYFIGLSCYVQNYILADIVAAQLKHAVNVNVLHGGTLPIRDNKKVGEYLITKLFTLGDLYPWQKLIEKSTGEPLNSQYFVNDLIENSEENKNTMPN